MLTISLAFQKLRLSGIRREKTATYGPLAHRCSRIIPCTEGFDTKHLNEAKDLKEAKTLLAELSA